MASYSEPMSRDRLLDRLRDCASTNARTHDSEVAHEEADAALLAYIGDEEITAAFKAIGVYYT